MPPAGLAAPFSDAPKVLRISGIVFLTPPAGLVTPNCLAPPNAPRVIDIEPSMPPAGLVTPNFLVPPNAPWVTDIEPSMPPAGMLASNILMLPPALHGLVTSSLRCPHRGFDIKSLDATPYAPRVIGNETVLPPAGYWH